MLGFAASRAVRVPAPRAPAPAAAAAAVRAVPTVRARAVSTGAAAKIKAPPMVYISGEEYTRYAAELYLKEWIQPHVDTSAWEFYDLSVASRDRTDDKVLHDAIAAGARIGSIYKEPTVTPTIDQARELNLKKAWGSPNGTMRAGWNGVSISRDTLHIPGLKMGYARPVLFDRHAVGGEYGAGYKTVGAGTLTLTFQPADGSAPVTIDSRKLTDAQNAAVVYHNPYDNVDVMAHHFFSRCLEANVTPYVSTKKTVFKWQETFWQKMRAVFNEHYRDQFNAAGLLKKSGGELGHFLSDVAAMKLVTWTQGGFGIACHNYDGDVLTDELAQVHRSPGFITSVLNGVKADGKTIIKEFEASHGTVTDMHEAHLRGVPVSLNPLSMMTALVGAIKHSVLLANNNKPNELTDFARNLRVAIFDQMAEPGQATRDMSGPTGLTTEQFVQAVKKRLAVSHP